MLRRNRAKQTFGKIDRPKFPSLAVRLGRGYVNPIEQMYAAVRNGKIFSKGRIQNAERKNGGVRDIDEMKSKDVYSRP